MEMSENALYEQPRAMVTSARQATPLANVEEPGRVPIPKARANAGLRTADDPTDSLTRNLPEPGEPDIESFGARVLNVIRVY
jgi:hypothetical protein